MRRGKVAAPRWSPRFALATALGLATMLGYGWVSLYGADPAADPNKLPAAPGLTAAKPDGWLTGALAQVDPAKSGWQTEALGSEADAQLKALAKLVAHPEQLDDEHLAKLAAAEVSVGALRPAVMPVVFRDGTITVSRPAPADAAQTPRRTGLAGLTAALKELMAPWQGGTDVRFEVKTFKVELDGTACETIGIFEAKAATTTGRIAQTGHWHCKWTRTGPGAPLLLSRLDVTDFEEVVHRGAATNLFPDVTESVLGANRSYREQLMYGLDHWRNRIEYGFGLDVVGYYGIAVGDVNGDGLDDLFVCQPGGLPNRLYLHQPDGTAKDISAEAGIDFLEMTRSALFVDLDNNGTQDLVLGIGTNVVFLSNDGTGKFTIRATIPTKGNVYSLCAADYDNDGRLDIYTCCYEPAGSALTERVPTTIPTPYHDANNGAPNLLIRNEGGWKFRDVTKEVGLDVNNRRFSFAAAWEDYDNSGRQSLAVANDFGRKNLYRNVGGKFVDVTAQAGCEDTGSGMSVAWADYDNDGLMDLYFGNMYSKAGNRIAFQSRFRSDNDDGTRARFQRFARGNTLLRNAGDGTFQDITEPAAVNLGRWAWSSNFVDLNNDGLEDIVVANGYITQESFADL